ncbi:hypothetical protein [Burkholderia gladioli]|uniref:hypothetical protein n=1 Tax=Burkholderia gladioli TaxID=28095 RepID=UPI00163E11D3|nr:hypothetical protein [Burkholderia gladioli]
MPNLQCKPGDLARVVSAASPALIGRIVFVEDLFDSGDWNVTLLGEPAFGITSISQRPVVTHRFRFYDSSLEPLRGDCLALKSDALESDHA